MEKETPYFDYELKKWLVLYSIGSGNKFHEVMPLTLYNTISELQSSGYVKVLEKKKPIYKKGGKILKYLGNTVENHYFLTKKGKEQLLFNWEFAASAIPKESYEEIFKNLCAISQS